MIIIHVHYMYDIFYHLVGKPGDLPDHYKEAIAQLREDMVPAETQVTRQVLMDYVTCMSLWCFPSLLCLEQRK